MQIQYRREGKAGARRNKRAREFLRMRVKVLTLTRLYRRRKKLRDGRYPVIMHVTRSARKASTNDKSANNSTVEKTM
ncbi:hypothetical protein NDU88_004545 [Pleurodeles waltl]|uniref:Uncharacterized protein n=1 Tax=Pleurodeles waltl TaxID=8319 RepID=A0AAV7T8T0_PLEWA|nr:hypothetical protein NDU88_004545 [Pleurodeles waltl]